MFIYLFIYYGKLEIKPSSNIFLLKMELKIHIEVITGSVLLSVQGSKFGEFVLFLITISFSSYL